MYANGLITMHESKSEQISQALKAVDMDLEQPADSSMRIADCYTGEIIRFLALENVTNTDMRRIIDRICVNRDGQVRILLKKFENMGCG